MKHRRTRALAIAGIFTSLLFSAASLAADLPKKKQTPQGLYLTAVEAYDFIREHKKDAVFIDVRTRAEVNFLGMPSDADANIPYMLTAGFTEWNPDKHDFKLAPNSNFLPAVEDLLAKRKLGKDARIVLMCRSGSRSAKAANLLHQAGYKNVYSVTDGYEGGKAKSGPQKGQRVVDGWRNANLPWTYKLDRKKMYWEM